MSAQDRERPLSTRLAELSEAIIAAKRRVRDAEQAHRKAEGDLSRLRDAVIDAPRTATKPARRRHPKSETRPRRRPCETLPKGSKVLSAPLRRPRPSAGTSLARTSTAFWRSAARMPSLPPRESRPPWSRSTGAGSVGCDRVGGHGAVAARGRPNDSLPRFPEALATLVRDAKRAGGVEVPAPLPSGQGMASVPRAPAVPVNLPKLDPEQKPPAREAA